LFDDHAPPAVAVAVPRLCRLKRRSIAALASEVPVIVGAVEPIGQVTVGRSVRTRPTGTDVARGKYVSKLPPKPDWLPNTWASKRYSPVAVPAGTLAVNASARVWFGV
jgi:hypothetical protein